MRFIGMDVHRDFCEIAIAEEGGRVRSAGRIPSALDALGLFAQSLAFDDVVALEATSGAGLIAEIIEPVGCANPSGGSRTPGAGSRP